MMHEKFDMSLCLSWYKRHLLCYCELVLTPPFHFRIQEFKVALSEENINLKTLRELCFNGNFHVLLFYKLLMLLHLSNHALIHLTQEFLLKEASDLFAGK